MKLFWLIASLDSLAHNNIYRYYIVCIHIFDTSTVDRPNHHHQLHNLQKRIKINIVKQG